MPVKTATYTHGTTTYEDVLAALNQPKEIERIVNEAIVRETPDARSTQIFNQLVMAVYGVEVDASKEVRTWPEGFGNFLAKDGCQAKLIEALEIESIMQRTTSSMRDAHVAVTTRMNEFSLKTPTGPGI